MSSNEIGRFPKNEIISLLQVNRRLNLAESTSQDLYFDDLIDLVGYENVKGLRLGYGSPQGAEILRDEVGQMCGISPDHVLATQGTALALYLLSLELCRPGDDVILFTPCFPPSRDTLIGGAVALTELALTFENGFQVDLVEFERCLTKITKFVSIATPQNPSGVATACQVIFEMLEIMGRVSPDAYLFIDETYANASYGKNQTAASFAGDHPKIITGSSVSKAYGAPGLRVGWMTTPDDDLRERLITAKMNIVISGSPLDETLAGLLLRKREAVLAPRRVMLGDAIKLVADWQMRNQAYLSWVRPDGGALCCMRLKEDTISDAGVRQFWQMLPDKELQLATGAWFGESERVFRLGFGYLPLNVLPEALTALEDVLKEIAVK